jgi:signal peptidase II
VAGVALAALAADQITKSLAVEYLRSGPVHLFGPFSFALSYNSGIAFSVGVGLTVPIVLVVVVVIGLLVWFARSVPSRPAAVAVGLVLGGAVGNLSDRFFRGHGGAVVDFIHSTFWPTFNVADSCVVCGCFLLAGTVIFQRPAGAPAAGNAPTGGPPTGDADTADR